MYVYIYVYIYTYVYIYIHIYIYANLSLSLSFYIYIHINIPWMLMKRAARATSVLTSHLPQLQEFVDGLLNLFLHDVPATSAPPLKRP